MLRRNGPVVKSVESVLRPEESLWWERFVKEVGLSGDSERVRELWMEKLVSRQSEKMRYYSFVTKCHGRISYDRLMAHQMTVSNIRSCHAPFQAAATMLLPGEVRPQPGCLPVTSSPPDSALTR